MLDPKLLEILACPKCRGPVVPDQKHTWLTCHACSVRYRVEGDIPIMLPDEAEKIPGRE
ncbi:MAG: Trm112 family protein [Krumholzibacteria bacterium]|nr:Trm112 family protein [Candidatus Krumholzibacteria bacterium]